jgi:hypothetical protein
MGINWPVDQVLNHRLLGLMVAACLLARVGLVLGSRPCQPSDNHNTCLPFILIFQAPSIFH